jgi:hypothetical protein
LANLLRDGKALVRQGRLHGRDGLELPSGRGRYGLFRVRHGLFRIRRPGLVTGDAQGRGREKSQ